LPNATPYRKFVRGALWWSGPGIIMTLLTGNPNGGVETSITAGVPNKISFGRPVLPPDVGAFMTGDTCSSASAATDVPAGISKPSGRCGSAPI
jgi:hypothetical protein